MPAPPADLSLLQVVKDLLGVLGTQVAVLGVLGVDVELRRDLQGEDFRGIREFPAGEDPRGVPYVWFPEVCRHFPASRGSRGLGFFLRSRGRSLLLLLRLSLRFRPVGGHRQRPAAGKPPLLSPRQQKGERRPGGGLRDALLQVVSVLGGHRGGAALLGRLLRRFLLPARDADLHLVSLRMKPGGAFTTFQTRRFEPTESWRRP